MSGWRNTDTGLIFFHEILFLLWLLWKLAETRTLLFFRGVFFRLSKNHGYSRELHVILEAVWRWSEQTRRDIPNYDSLGRSRRGNRIYLGVSRYLFPPFAHVPTLGRSSSSPVLSQNCSRQPIVGYWFAHRPTVLRMTEELKLHAWHSYNETDLSAQTALLWPGAKV